MVSTQASRLFRWLPLIVGLALMGTSTVWAQAPEGDPPEAPASKAEAEKPPAVDENAKDEAAKDPEAEPPAVPSPAPPALPDAAAPPEPNPEPPAPPDAPAAEGQASAAKTEVETKPAKKALRPAEDPDLTTFFGEWRAIYSHMQDFPLNETGDSSGLNWYLDQRLDVGVEQDLSDRLSFGAELELFYGQVAGEFDHVGAAHRLDARETLPGWDLKNAELRQLWLTWRSDWFQLKAGQMGSHWGLGLLANDGRPTPGRLGYQDQGDLSDRVVIATKPFKTLFPKSWAAEIVAALGGGVVYRDENTSLRDGDVGGEALLSVFYPGEQLWVGMYVAGRFAKDEPGTRLDVVALDFYGRYEPKPGESGLVAAVELAYVTGKTDRIITADRLGGLNISALGAVGRIGWHFGCIDLRSQLEVGFASGDPDPHDSTITAFSFDPDYKVGLVLFDTVMRGVSAMAAQEAADPERIGQALPGTDLLASRGRVSNAVYIYPNVSVKPLERLSLMAGFLWAFSVVEFSQSYQTFKNGGVLTNPYGLSGAGHDLGYELNLGAAWDQPVWGDFHLVGGLQAGWFFPGSAFERPDGSRPGIVARLQSLVAVTW
jgi:hypothetical protein